MQPDFWSERWSRNQIGFHQGEINSLLRAHWSRLHVPKGAKVFVPLCGKSRDIMWLRARGHHVVGVELIRIALHDFFAENALTPTVTAQPPFERWEADGVTLWCGDFFDLIAVDLDDVGAVYDRASLIALPPDMRQRYVEHMHSILPPRAETLLVTLSYPEGEMKGPPFSVTDAEVQSLYGDSFIVQRLVAHDALAENEHLRARGLTQLTEQAYRLQPRRAP